MLTVQPRRSVGTSDVRKTRAVWKLAIRRVAEGKILLGREADNIKIVVIPMSGKNPFLILLFRSDHLLSQEFIV